MPKSRPIATIALGITAALCAGAALYWWLGVESTSVYTDDGEISAPAEAAAPRDVLWRPPEGIDAVNSALAEGTPRVSPQGDEIYLTRTTGDGGSDLYVARREGQTWSDPEPVSALNSPDNEIGAAVSPDGGWIYFASDRPGGAGGYDLWRAAREGAGWAAPEPLGAGINSPANELHPAPDADGTLLFTSDRAPESGEELAGFDIYLAHPDADQPATPVAPLNSTSDDVGVAVSPSGDFVYLSSDRPGGAGGFDLYRVRRTAEGFGPLEPLGAPINTPSNELEPSLAMGGFALLYASDAPGTKGATDVFRSVSREVYLARGSRFAGLWGELLGLLPWLLAILALILLLAMLRRVHAGGAWEGRLSTLGLMARCVLASLVMHALLMALLAYWQVHLAPGSPLGDEDGTRVSLVSGAGAQSLGAQVRGGFTEAELARAESATITPDAMPDATRDLRATELQAAADASAVERAMPVQAARSDTQTAETGASTAIAADADMQPTSESATLATPGATSRAMTGESAREIARSESAASVADAPTTGAATSAPSRSAEVAAAAGDRTQGHSMRVEAGASDSAVPEAGANAPSIAMSIEPGAVGSPSVDLPRGAGRALRSETDVLGPARAPSSGGSSSPAAAAIAGSAGCDVEPMPAADAHRMDAPLAFGADGSDAALSDAVTGPAVSGASIDPADAGALASGEIATPDGASGGAPVRSESSPGVSRASASSVAAVPGVTAAATGTATTAQLEPAASSAAPTDAIAFQAPSLGAAANELSTPGFEVPTISQSEDLNALTLAPLAAPGATQDEPLVAEQRRGVTRARASSNEVDPRAFASSASPSSEVRPELAASQHGSEALAVGHDNEDARVAEQAAPAYESAELPIALGADTLGSIAMPDAAPRSEPELAESAVERSMESGRALTGPSSLPDTSAAVRIGAAELGTATPQADDEGFGFGTAGRTARADASSPAPLGVPDAPGLEPVSQITISLPVPAAPLRLTGVVLDDETGEPIAGASVRLDLIDTQGIELTTETDGTFAMGLDDVPDNIALAAFADGYVPGALNIAEDDLADEGAYAEFRLVPFNPFEIAMEEEPRVRHLGNDEFSGRINSQFQRESEGREIRFEFDLGPQQLPPNVQRAEIVLLTKGVQLPNPVGVNGRRLATTLSESPNDGSFGEQRIPIPLAHLVPGQNWIAFRSIRQPGTDIDDFEFVNVRVVFDPVGDAAPW